MGKVEVTLGVLVHALDKSRLCFRDGFDLRRHHIAEVVQTHIALALHAEGRDAMACDLGKQGAADPLDAKGEAGMLDGAGVAEVAKHSQELCGLFLVQPVQQVGDVGVGIAELCGGGHHLFRLRSMGDQTNCHHTVSQSSVILVRGAKLAMVFLMPTFSKLISTIWSPAAAFTETTLPRPNTLCSTTSPGS